MPRHGPAPKSRRIYFRNGYWWFEDPKGSRLVKLDPEIERSDWNVGRLCGILGLGARTFSRLMEESLGICSKRWLRELRIVKARHMLREECKVSVVALSLGFGHPSDFTREFKKMTGVSPADYMSRERSRSAIQSASEMQRHGNV